MARFAIGNMNCGGCAKGVTSTVTGADPAASVEVQLDSKQITVDGSSISSEALIAALRAAGWKADVATT
jgi:copper chaperone